MESKISPPFCPTYELILQLTLPVNILDGFHIFCPTDTLEWWVAEVKDYDDILYITKKVHSELWCFRTMEATCWCDKGHSLWEHPALQPQFTDIICLKVFNQTQWHTDIGSVINILAHWMLMFHRMGKTLKYVDALFHLLAYLKQMHPQLWSVLLP